MRGKFCRYGKGAHWLITAGLITFMLSACGGGGGGTSTSSPALGDGTPSATGLVPSAPSVGATLYASASDIRPVMSGAKWIYHLHDFTHGYDHEVTTSAVSGPGASVKETDSDDPTSHVDVTLDGSGSVVISSTVPLGGSMSVPVSGYELRSPVRENDQYVLLDRTVADSGTDVDGDGTNDPVQIAIYSRVIGNEAVTLPNHAAAVTALRVDTVIALRFLPSRGTSQPPVSTKSSAWYVANVGMVRQVLRDVDSDAVSSEYLLLGFDGVTRGWGYIVQPAQTDAQLPRFLNLGPVGSAAARDDGVIIVANGALHRLDRNGKVIAAYAIPAGIWGLPRALFATSAGIRAISGYWPAWQIEAFTAEGQYVSTLSTFDFSNGRAGIGTDTDARLGSSPQSDTMWVVWHRDYSLGSGQRANEVVVRRLAADGSTSAPELTIPVANSMSGGSLRLEVRFDGATLNWSEDGAQATMRAVRLDNAGHVVWNQSLPLPWGIGAGPAMSWSDTSSTVMGWSQDAMPGFHATPSAAGAVPHGVRLDSGGNVVGIGSDAASLAAAQLSGIDGDVALDWPLLVVANNGHLFGTGTGNGFLFADDKYTTPWLTFAEYDVSGTSSLSTSIRPVNLYHIPGLTLSRVIKPVVFSDRVLLLTESAGELRPVVIWR